MDNENHEGKQTNSHRFGGSWRTHRVYESAALFEDGLPSVALHPGGLGAEPGHNEFVGRADGGQRQRGAGDEQQLDGHGE